MENDQDDRAMESVPDVPVMGIDLACCLSVPDDRGIVQVDRVTDQGDQATAFRIAVTGAITYTIAEIITVIAGGIATATSSVPAGATTGIATATAGAGPRGLD